MEGGSGSPGAEGGRGGGGETTTEGVERQVGANLRLGREGKEAPCRDNSLHVPWAVSTSSTSNGFPRATLTRTAKRAARCAIKASTRADLPVRFRMSNSTLTCVSCLLCRPLMPCPFPSKKNHVSHFTPSNIRRLISNMSSPLPRAPPPPTSLTSTQCALNSLLDACRTMKEFKQIHSLMIRTGLARSPLVKRRLLSCCCARGFGDMSYARLLLDLIPTPETSLWNCLIRGHSVRGAPWAAVAVYAEMLASGVGPNSHTFPFLLKGFTRDDAVACGDELHAHVLKFGLSSNAHVRSALLHMYAVSGAVDTARELFEKSPERDVVSWNAMISGYNRSNMFEESCRLLAAMAGESVMPTATTYVLVLSACAKMKGLECGRQIHRRLMNANLLPDLRLENALIEMYGQCGDLDSAWRLFQDMQTRDVISWTAVVVGFAKSGEVDRARALFDRMPERDRISWTAMIDGYVRAGRFKEALHVFREMQAADVRPDEFTMVSLLTACAQLGALEMGEWTRAYMERNGIKMDIAVGNALVDMYSKCGQVDNAVEIFRRMHRKDKFTWTAMISGLAVNGHGEDAIDLFSQMVESSVRPDEVTYIGVLAACAHAGLVDEGRRIFSSMIAVHGIMPNVTHYGCLVDLLGRAGRLEEASETISNMPMKPNSAVWGALLGACRVHGNLEMAELAAKHLVELQPHDSAAYLLLCSMYANRNKSEEARKMRETIMVKGIKKEPGCSLVEMNGEVHEFVAGDRSHPRTAEIYTKLEEMIKELKRAGYVPDTWEILHGAGEEEAANAAIYQHSEKLAVAFGLIGSRSGVAIRVVKNLRICIDCHNAMKLASKVYRREIVVRDRRRFHHFRSGVLFPCSWQSGFRFCVCWPRVRLSSRRPTETDAAVSNRPLCGSQAGGRARHANSGQLHSVRSWLTIHAPKFGDASLVGPTLWLFKLPLLRGDPTTRFDSPGKPAVRGAALFFFSPSAAAPSSPSPNLSSRSQGPPVTPLMGSRELRRYRSLLTIGNSSLSSSLVLSPVAPFLALEDVRGFWLALGICFPEMVKYLLNQKKGKKAFLTKSKTSTSVAEDRPQKKLRLTDKSTDPSINLLTNKTITGSRELRIECGEASDVALKKLELGKRAKYDELQLRKDSNPVRKDTVIDHTSDASRSQFLDRSKWFRHDIMYKVFQQQCRVKVIQQATFQNHNYGITCCNSCQIILPLVSSIGMLKIPAKTSTLVGHLPTYRSRFQVQQEEMKCAVSTSHGSQPNTVEYDLALGWLLLQDKYLLAQKLLHESQLKERRYFRNHLKSKQSRATGGFERERGKSLTTHMPRALGMGTAGPEASFLNAHVHAPLAIQFIPSTLVKEKSLYGPPLTFSVPRPIARGPFLPLPENQASAWVGDGIGFFSPHSPAEPAFQVSVFRFQ
ncbi:PPR repeat [Musa troglodytarum]|uniref:PPR repeat n=1 Tax=Musa troglodytarum TaxID=320322 RepID=A0A9E7LDF4_9LILI|nr:PPR repeat [Musa troglodytarum]